MSNPGPASTVTPNGVAPFGNVQSVAIISSALTPSSVAANTSAEQTFTITGLAVGDMAVVNKPTTQAGLGIVNARISAANTLAIAYANLTTAALTPLAETYTIASLRPAPGNNAFTGDPY